MALIPSAQYPSQTDADPAYPQGKARNAGSFQDGTGTPFEKSWLNDLWGFLQALLSNASITPSGTPDQVGASQYLDGVAFIGQTKADAAEKRLMLSNWTIGGIIDPTVTSLTAISWCPSLNLFIAGGSDKLVKSTDGGVWDLASGSMGVGIFTRGVADNLAGAAVAVGTTGTVKRSTNGNTWAAQTSGTANELRDVVWHINKFISVGASNTIITSPDGITWTSRTSPAANWKRVASNGTNLAVAVGDGGAIATSPDGITWTSRTSGTAQNLAGVCWNGSQFVACGGSSAVLTSPDGITWTSRTSGFVGSHNSIVSVDGFLVIAGGGSGGGATLSRDGVTWKTIPPATIGLFGSGLNMAYDGKTCIMTGQGSPSGTVFLRSLTRLAL